jgi:hypothetical protein
VAGVALQQFEMGSTALNSLGMGRERGDGLCLSRIARAEIEEMGGNIECVLRGE